MVRLIFLCLLLLLCQLKPSTGDQDSDDYNHCTEAPDPGPCRAAIHMYYYDTKTDSCEEFIYGGCDGNDNRYKTLEGCKSSCIRDESNHDLLGMATF
ncbi:protease inhibitor-like [Pholidichthys leucotaenia]